MKKIVIMLVACGGLFAALPLAADTETVDGYTWTYRINGDTAEICGTAVYNSYFPCISSSSTGDVTIPSMLGGKPVTSIGQKAFQGCSRLTHVTIPDSVTSIGFRAFYGCSGLTNVTIPDSVTSIGKNAFEGCSGLTSVTIPDSVTSIGDEAFRGCSGLTSVTIPDSVTSIGDYAFYSCSGLKSVTIPDSVTSIGDYAFRGCSGLTSVTIGNGVTSIGDDAFYGCNKSLYDTTTIPGVKLVDGWAVGWTDTLRGALDLTGVRGIGDEAFFDCRGLTSVMIPDSVTSIGDYAFYSCRGLTSVTILDSVTNIGSYAFYSCRGLTSVTIGSGVTSIGVRAFDDCNSLTNVYIDDIGKWCGIPFASETANPMYRADKLYLKGELLTALEIPEGVTNIGAYAFYGCSGLTSVTIGNGVTSIGDGAFLGCSGLTSVTIPGSVTGIGESAFERCDGLTNVTIPDSVTSIGKNAFEGCSGLTSVTIPDSVTSIGDYAFYSCSGLTSVTIPDSVTSIGYGAFDGCSGLTSVTIPRSVTSIGGGAFSYCSGLTSVTIPDSVTSIGGYVFRGCSGLTSVTIPDSVTSIGGEAFANCSGLTSVTIPGSVTSIGYGAFAGCSGLTSVTIPDSVTSIGDEAFRGCSGLTSVTIPGSVTSIGYGAFDGCSGLTSVTIPGSVTSIGYGAFAGCSGLTSVTITDIAKWCGIWFGNYDANPLYCAHKLYLNDELLSELTLPDSVTSIGYGAFAGCSGLTSITIPGSVTSIGYGAFDGCSGLTSVTIPDSVTNIGEYAFHYCSGLTNAIVGKGVAKIDQGLFSGCGSLESITIPFVGRERGNAGNDTRFGYIFGYEAYPGGEEYQNGWFIPSTLATVVVTDETRFDSGAFSGCKQIAKVAIPDTLTNMGTNVFYGCNDALFDTTSVPGVKLVDGWAIGYDKTLSGDVDLGGARGIGPSAFSMCSDITSVVIGENVAVIEPYAFECCDNLTNVTICATNLATIGDFAFPAFLPQQDDCIYVFVSEKGAPAVLPRIKRDNTNFDGWWTEPEGGEKVENAAAVVPGKAYYAHWTKPVISRIELAIPDTITVWDDDYQKICHDGGSYGINPAFIAAVYDQNGQSIENWEEYGIIEFYRHDELYATHSSSNGTILNDGSYFYGLPGGSWLVKVVGDGVYIDGSASTTLQVDRVYYSDSRSDFTYWHLQISDGYYGYYSARDVHSGSTYIGYVDLGAYSAGSGGSVYIDVDDGAIPSYSSGYESSYGCNLSGYREFSGYRDGPGFQSPVYDDASRLITNAGLYWFDVSIDGSWSYWDDYYSEYVTFYGHDSIAVYLAPADFSSQTVSAVNAERVYTGEAISILDTDFSIELSDPTSYFIENKTVVDAGTYSVNIGVMSEGASGSADWFCDPYEYERRSAGDYDYTTTWEERIVKDENDCPIFNYTGVVEVVYTVLPRPVAAGQISFSMPQNLVYDGTAKALSNISITNDFNGVELVEGTDYDVIYTDNVLPGRATAAIVCKDNYTGRFETAYQITPADFDIGHDEETGMYSGASGNIVPYEGVYDGEGHWALGEAAYGDDGQATVRYALSENGPYGEDYIVFTNVCDETVWVELSAPGYNSFTGAVKVVITPRSIENATVAARNTVEGPGRQPVFTLDVQDDGIGRTLVEGVDYCANVVNDDASGTTTVTVTGMGNYVGERVVETAYVKTCNIGGVDWQYWSAGDRAWLVSAKQSSEEMPSVVAIPDEIDGLPVREVPDGFFAGCKSIETVVVGANAAKFGDSVFDGCTALKYVVFAGDVPDANRYVFADAPSDVQIVAAKKDGGWGEAWPAGDEARQVMQAPTVGITPFSGKKSGRMAVTMTHDCEIPEAVVRYTTDGTEPTATSTFYEKRFSINVTGLVSVKAAVFLGGVRISDVSETRYSPVLNDVLNIGDIIAKPGSAPLFFDLDSRNQWWCDETETSFDGTPSMKSGRIGNDSSSWMSATFTGAGVLEFSWKASCEEDNLGEFFYDHAVCELDGEEVAWIDGDSGEWERVEIAVETAGEHIVKWIYTKDAADDTIYPGADCVWVDGVKFSYPVYVSFAAGDGTGEPPEPLMGAIGYEVKLPDKGGLTCAKHRFAGWSDGECVYGAGDSYAVGAADVTLTAVWSEKVLDAPVIEVPEMFDEESATVTIAASPGVAIYYTIDGSEPDAETGVLYEGAFRVSGTTMIRAVAVADDWFDSAVAEAQTTRSWTSLEECLGAAGFALATGGDANWIGDAREGCVKTAAHAGGWLTAAFEGPGVATYLLKEGDGEWTRHDEVFPDAGEHVLRWEGTSLMLKDLELLSVVSVSFAAGDGVAGDVPPTIYTAEGRYIEIPGGDGLTCAKHVFAGWSDGVRVHGAGGSYAVGAADVTLTAVWSEKRLSAPVIDAPATYEADSATVTIAAASGATVYYTTDGTEPSADNPASMIYQGPFAIEGSVTVKAVAVREDWFDSDVVSCVVTRLPWTLGECLNWPEQDFATYGDAAWERVKSASADGFALKSGKIGNKQMSRLSTTVQGEGVISFLMKVSSECDAETGEAYDGLVFSVDGDDVMDLAGGELDWRRATFRVEGEGTHVLEWRYEKDKRDLGGSDCAWLDEVSWTPKGSVPHVAVASGKGEIAKVGSGYAVTAADGVVLAEDDFTFGSVSKEAYRIEIAADGKSATVMLAPPRIAAAETVERMKDPGDPAGVLVVVDEDAIAAKPASGSGERVGALPVKTHPGLFYQASWGDDPRNLVPGEKVQATGDILYLGVIRQTGAKGFYKVSVGEQ